MQQWITANKDKVRRKLVLVGKAAVIPVDFTAPQKRRPDDQVKAMYDPSSPNAGFSCSYYPPGTDLLRVRPRSDP